MKKEVIDKLNPANLTIEDAKTIDRLDVESLKLLGNTYPANVNFLEVVNKETNVKFNTHYRALIWHKTNYPNAMFEVVGILPISGTMIAKPVVAPQPQKVEPPKPLVNEPPAEENADLEASSEGVVEEPANVQEEFAEPTIEKADETPVVDEEQKVEPPKPQQKKTTKNKRKNNKKGK